MRILGVDPGRNGALALLTDQGRTLRVVDLPVLVVKRGNGTKGELDAFALHDLLSEMAPDVCYFEKVAGQRGDGVSAAFNFGEITGACKMACILTGARFIPVTPPAWKRAMKLIGAAKDDSRAKAMQLWPENASDFRRQKDDGRADAALIAEHGRLEQIKQGVFG